LHVNEQMDAGSTERECGRRFTSVMELVAHLTVDHVGGAEQTDHSCYWRDVNVSTSRSKRNTNLSITFAFTRARSRFLVRTQAAARYSPGPKTSRFTSEYTQVCILTETS